MRRSKTQPATHTLRMGHAEQFTRCINNGGNIMRPPAAMYMRFVCVCACACLRERKHNRGICARTKNKKKKNHPPLKCVRRHRNQNGTFSFDNECHSRHSPHRTDEYECNRAVWHNTSLIASTSTVYPIRFWESSGAWAVREYII